VLRIVTLRRTSVLSSKFKQTVHELWQISWPLIIANSFWNIQVTIDRMFLGQYSTETLGAAIAAVGFFWAPMALVQQTAAYVTTFVAQYYGAKQLHWIGPSLWHSLYVSVVGGLLFLVLVPVSPEIFAWMGHSPELQNLEVDYFQALAFSALPTALVAACSGFFTGIGKSRMIILINGVGLLLNILFDYLLIFGHWGFPSMGIAGAGWATTAANCGGALFGFCVVFFGSEAKEYQLLQGWRFNRDLMIRFIRFGFPSGLQWALEGLAFTVFLAFIGRLPNGDSALAASSITVTILMLAILPVIGVAQGVSALVGQQLGQNDSERAVEFAWVGLAMSTLYILTIVASFVFLPGIYLSMFQSAEPTPLWAEVASMVPYLLMFVAVFVFFDSMNIIFSFTLKGAGDTQFVSAVALLLPWPIMVLPTWYVSGWEQGVYWAWGAASVLFACRA
jgi:MATE family multidrug resistance protein